MAFKHTVINGKYTGKHTAREAAKEASLDNSKGKTILRINNGSMYVNQHAEMVMMNDNEPSDISEMYIRNTPCHRCSDELVKYFDNTTPKPTIYIGKIWKRHDEESDADSRGIKQLIREKFKLKVWKEFKCLKPEKGEKLEEYLAEIKKEMAEEV